MTEPGMSYDPFINPPNDPASFIANRSELDSSASLLQALAQANGFTLEELQTNHEGWMSLRQRTGVVRRTIGFLFLLLLLVGSVVGGVVTALVVIVGGFWPLMVVLLGVAVFALLSFTFIKGARQQLREGRVAFIDGFVERERKESYDSESGTTTNYYYVVYQPQPSEVKRQRFSVNGAAYHALVPGLHYRIYYLPSYHKMADYRLVSIEPLP